MAERLQPSQGSPVEAESSLDVRARPELAQTFARIAALATTAKQAEGPAEADAIAQALGTLRGKPSRQAADQLRQLLETGALEGLAASDGRTCRAVAVDVLLTFGFPFALEVTPEDLAHYRAHGRPRRWTPAVVSGGLLVLALSGLELGTALATADRPGVTAAHAVLTLVAAAAVVLAGRRSVRWLALGALALAGALGIAGGLLGLAGTLVPGLGALVAAALMAGRPAS